MDADGLADLFVGAPFYHKVSQLFVCLSVCLFVCLLGPLSTIRYPTWSCSMTIFHCHVDDDDEDDHHQDNCLAIFLLGRFSAGWFLAALPALSIPSRENADMFFPQNGAGGAVYYYRNSPSG